MLKEHWGGGRGEELIRHGNHGQGGHISIKVKFSLCFIVGLLPPANEVAGR